ncbi:MAG: SDR family oxidoreductase [Nitrospinota bacterium]|jgi:NAD(P)-dependent dehydrogenase (short-subunit alcohol dehydrogenase family)|nr:SDR family oxidoreductase [Nitrospinota bacterium]
MELKGRVALITGAAQGIGEGIARRIIYEGGRVAGVDIQGEGLSSLEREFGESFLGIKADLSREAEVERIFGESVSRFGGIDILVNCAVVRSNIPLEDIDEPTMDLALAVGVKGCVLCAQRAAREMRKRGGGAIVNMSSFYARTPVKERVIYVAVKGAVEGVTRALAVELAEFGIRVNAVAPGPILTERRKSQGHGQPGNLEERYRRMPMGRFGEVSEVIDSVIFLMTSQSSYMTGQTIVLDGGMTIV